MSSSQVDAIIDTDVLVIGGGPAGAAAAATLAAAGRRVLVADKATFPRDKCCGDGLTTGALRVLEQLGFDPTTVASWTQVDACWVRSPSGREVRFPMPSDHGASGLFAAVAPRAEFDAALLAHAERAGATVQTGSGFESVIRNDDVDSIVAVVNGLGAVRARYLIAADGMWSPVRKALGLGSTGYLGEWHAFRQYFRGVTGPAAERMYVWFEPDLLPGYAWSFPLPDGRVNVGFGIARDGVRKIQDMKAVWPELLRRPHIAAALGPDAEGEDRHTAWPIPARVDKAALTSGRVLFVGDAACATDVLTGEGIGQALLTGVLAAEAVLARGAADPGGVRRHYERSVGHHLIADHRMSSLLTRLLSREWVARGAIRLAGSNDWTKRSFGRWLFEDEPRAILFTPRRWHRRLLASDGPFGSESPT